MYEVPGDYLLTYDPDFLEQHNDSSDFEESCIPMIAKKGGNHSLLNHNQIRKRCMMNPVYLERHGVYDEHPVKLSRKRADTWAKATQVSMTKNNVTKKEHKTNNLSSGDQPQHVQSKLSLFRHKVIPCLSSIFGRSRIQNNIHAKENHENTAKDNACQHCSNCERRRIKKLYKRHQNYAVQPVYAIEGNIHKAPVPFTPKMTEKPLQKHNRKKSRNQYSSCSFTSSSESETELTEEIKRKSMKMRKRFKTEIMKEHWKYQQNQHFKNQQHQYPSKDRKSPYHVFTSPYQQSRTNVSPSNSQYASEMPASSSGFWEYLFDKINRKYQIQKVEMPKPCQCSSGEQTPCSPSNCENFEPQPEPGCCMGHQQSPPGNSCACSTPKSEPPMGGCCQKNSPFESLPPPPSPVLSPLPRNSTSIKTKLQEKVQCKCFDKADKQSKAPSKAPRLPSQAPRFPSQAPKPPSQGGASIKPCQEGHDEITASLADKYHGEILCIHNPPCILINGCLNLPPQKEPQQQMNFWPVTENKKSGFYSRKKKTSKGSTEKCEQACQYHVPYVEVHQCQTPDYKVEKHIQSICHHDPPCEVVRGCYKPKYDPKLHNSCVHVPMCKKIPECIIGTRAEGKDSCGHRPKCPEIPLCSRNYTVLTARENFGAQAKPKLNLVCRHVPHCIMIPKCLGRAMCDSYVPWEAIPDCTHQPACDMIPACCRKCAKEMVSVSSQYPNSCRIV